MGVRRAVETTLEVIQKNDTGVFTFGPLIHNPQVLNLLEERGVKILKDIPEKENGTVIIRAHGAPPLYKEQLQRAIRERASDLLGTPPGTICASRAAA